MPERRAIDIRVRPPAPGFETLALYWDKPRIIGMGRDSASSRRRPTSSTL